MNLFDKFVSYLTPGHLEGIVLFILLMIFMSTVYSKNLKDWIDGLKGPNRYWEGPEILLYICFWLFPIMIFADIFLQLKASDIVWYIFGGSIFGGLFGRFGLEWILAVKNGSTRVTTIEKTVEKEKVKTEHNEDTN